MSKDANAKPKAQLDIGVGSRRWLLPERYRMRKLLGSGSYGTVCEALDEDTKELVAIKKISRLFDNLIDCKRILREVSIQTRLQHPNIVKIQNIFLPLEQTMQNFDCLFIVLEICDSDLKHLCKKDITLELTHIIPMMHSLLTGLRYLHSSGVWHRDLKPANCLVNQDCSVKICDFGLARAIANEQSDELPNTPREGEETNGDDDVIVPVSQRAKKALTNHVVTRFYRAPELILLQTVYTQSIDMWSVGCIFAELLQLLPNGQPFEDRGALFPGQSAFPWSPVKGHKDDCLYHTRGSREMMNHIFDCIGTPTEEEIQLLQREDSKQYVKLFRPRPGYGLRNKFSYADDNSIDLLEKMLRFNASARISDDDALEHPLFETYEDEAVEESPAPRITLDFDAELSQPMSSANMEQRLRTLLMDVINKQAEAQTGDKGDGYVS